ncbi:2-keto-4-pentenoate hydratase [Phenylobacterium sp.]|uniref:2-keto-4-pentenoate hydratase n=1 Tax=Phenylobacterium sp. TaxID=1871053 RepID=UPI002BE9EC38|nr:2-keto-4-pentenoate hydratase [Phenylobacterium sp.]HVI33344.1 2-keto-4-pentenoate hydratase [Phenylobacterium sp.]
MTEPAATPARDGNALAIARRFTDARRTAQALSEFPGRLPQTLDEGYATQEIAIGLWPDEIAGWKIGKVPPAVQAEVGATRLAGPIFRASVQTPAAGQAGTFPMIPGGFAAVEAEVIVRVARDAPANRLDWTPEEAFEYVGEMLIGMEPAGSPLSIINELGPKVVVSDFGNNAGLVLGPAIPGWRERAPESLTCATLVNGVVVGTGSAASLEGGPLGCFAWMLEHAARRGRPLRAGCLITTGQLTGIHEVAPGDEAVVDFGPLGSVRCTATIAQAK